MQTNTKRPAIHTHEGAVAKHINVEAKLRRTLLSALLGEDTFYEDGQSIASRISEYAASMSKDKLAALAIEARTDFGLRHAPLLLLTELARRGGSGVADAINDTIQRVDEMPELLAIYWKDGKKPISAQLRKGLAKAFTKFDEYSLAKYNRDKQIKLKDVMFMVHPKPYGADQEALFKRVANNSLATPNTWEVRISACGNDSIAKKAVWEDLLRTNMLGYMAVLRNLRNMDAVGVDEGLIRDAILARRGAKYVYPFRYTAAARVIPKYERYIDEALKASVVDSHKFEGKTIVVVDHSVSMNVPVSQKSEITRFDAAATLASVINGDVRVFAFGTETIEVPHRLGMAGIDAIKNCYVGWSTNAGNAVRIINQYPHDRLIFITDEQSRDNLPDPIAKNAYMINVAPYQNGIGYGRWTHIDGFSESVIKFIIEHERLMLGEVA